MSNTAIGQRPDTPLARRLARLGKLPGGKLLTTLVLRRTVPYLGTAGIRFVGAELGSATLALDDRRRVRNHIHGVHAAAAALLAEATSGMALAYHMPEGGIYLLTRMEIAYEQRMQGGLTATAHLDEATRARVRDEPRGEATFDVEVRDDSGNKPLQARLTWAWRPSRRNVRQASVGHSQKD